MVESIKPFKEILTYNRETVKYRSDIKCWEDMDGKLYNGVGVGRHIYGKAKPQETSEMTQGKTLHSQIENREPEDKAAIAICNWLDEKMPITCGQEIFLHGELFEVPTVGWADCVGSVGKVLSIVDYKFTNRPSKDRFDLKWKMQLVMYMMLLRQMGWFAPRLILLSVKPGSGKLFEHVLTPEEYGSVLSLARQFSIKNRVANI